MNGIATTLCSFLALVPRDGADAQADKSLAVHVSAASVEARAEVDPATTVALKKRRDEARDARKAFEKEATAEHGKRSAWPPDKVEALYRLREAEALTDVDYDYRKVDPKALADAVQDLVGSFRGKGLPLRKKHVNLVASADEAELLVKVTGRRSELGSLCYVLVSVGAGPRMDPTRFARVPRAYQPLVIFGYARTVAAAGSQRDVFVFEARNGPSSLTCHGAAAELAADVVDQFIQANYGVITAQ